MKINQEFWPTMETATKTPAETANARSSFAEIVQSQSSQLKHQGLNQLVQDIADQGDKLARFRSFRDLTRFKRMVRDFMKKTLPNGLRLQSGHRFSMSSGNHKLTIVKTVDDKLIQLTDDIMNQEKKTVDLLELIGEIKGLLMNIYT